MTQGKNFLNVHCRRIIYFAHIQSHVNYCLSVWGNLINREQTSKIERLLCKSGKLISKYTNLKFLTLKQLIKLENYKFGYKLIHGLLPRKILKCALTDHSGKSLSKTHSYNTRNKLVPNLPKVKSSKYLKSIFCMGHKEYCLLDSGIKNSKHLSTFVKLCKRKLLA